MYVPLEREGTSPILLDYIKLFRTLHWKHLRYSNAVLSFILQFCVWWGNICILSANIHLCYYFVKEVDENDSTDFSPIAVAKLGNLNLSTVSNSHQKYNQFSIQVLQRINLLDSQLIFPVEWSLIFIRLHWSSTWIWNLSGMGLLLHQCFGGINLITAIQMIVCWRLFLSNWPPVQRLSNLDTRLFFFR